MTSEGLGDMFEGDSLESCAGKFPLTLMGGRAEGLACPDPGSEDPHRRERKFVIRCVLKLFCDSQSVLFSLILFHLI